MAVEAAGHVRLGALDIDALLGAAAHVQEQVGIGLLARPLGPVAFGVGHGAAEHLVAGLHALQPGDEAAVGVRARLPGREEEGVEALKKAGDMGYTPPGS